MKHDQRHYPAARKAAAKTGANRPIDHIGNFFRQEGEQALSPGVAIALVVAVTAVILLLPFGARLLDNAPLLQGTTSAKTLALLHHVDFSSITLKDPFLPGSWGTGPFLRLLAASGLPDTALLFVPFLLGIITVLLWWILLSSLFLRRYALTILLLMVLNPLFIAVFTELSSWCFLLFLFSAAIAFLRSGRNSWAGFLIVILFLEEPFAALAGFVLILCFLIYTDTRKKQGGRSLRGSRIIWLSGISAAAFVTSLLLQPASPVAFENAFMSISDLGVPYGISSTIILLAIIGAVVRWRSTEGTRSGLILGYGFMLLGLVWLPARVFCIILFALAAGEGVKFLAVRSWSYQMMKQFTLLLIGCTLFISLSTFYSFSVIQAPHADLAQALEGLRPLSIERPILAQPGMGEFIEYYAGKQVVIDATAELRGDREGVETQRLLLSRNIQETQDALRDLGIDRILIDPGLRQTLAENGQGILFLIDFTPDFTQVNQDMTYRLYAFNASKETGPPIDSPKHP